MVATSEGAVVSIGTDFVDAVTMVEGWRVMLHAMPQRTFRVSLAVAPTVDAAQLTAFCIAKRTAGRLASDAATVQRF